MPLNGGLGGDETHFSVRLGFRKTKHWYPKSTLEPCACCTLKVFLHLLSPSTSSSLLFLAPANIHSSGGGGYTNPSLCFTHSCACYVLSCVWWNCRDCGEQDWKWREPSGHLWAPALEAVLWQAKVAAGIHKPDTWTGTLPMAGMPSC